MTEAVPRLLIVEAGETLSALVRATFDLLGRRCRIVTASTALDAFDELGVRVPDVLLTADQLLGDHRGLELANQAREALPDLPIILIADQSTPDLTAAQRLIVLSRPIAPDQVWRAIRAALNEPDDAPPVLVTVEDLGPVPPINLAQLQPVLIRLVGEVGAAAGALADRTGLLLLSAGAPAYLNLPQLAALIRPAALSTAQLNPLLGERLRTLNYYDGTRYDVFSLGVGLNHFIFLVFDTATGERALGGVRRYGNAAVDEMIRKLGEVASQLTPPEPPRAATPPPRSAVPTAAEPRTVRTPDPVRAPPPTDSALLIPDMDLSVFDGGYMHDSNGSDDPFAPDRIESLMNTINDRDNNGDGLMYQSGL